MSKNPLELVKTIISMRKPSVLIKRLAELFLGYPLYAISFITYRNKSKWLFGTNVSFTDNSKYLYIYILENHKELMPIWITESQKDVTKIRSFGGKAYLKYSIKGIYHCLTSKVYIYTYHSKDINFFTSGNAKKVNLWHGVGIKCGTGGKKTKDRQFTSKSGLITRVLMPYYFERDNLFLSTSEMMDKHFMNMFNLSEKQVFDSIYPRCHFMCAPKNLLMNHINKYEEKNLQNFISQIGKYDKTYLYMPTWRGNLSDDFIAEAGFDFARLDETMRELNRLFIFKLHPAVKLLNNISNKKYSNILFMDKNMDIYPILPFVDTLITDYSSIYYDFILLNKDIILYPFDKKSYIDTSNELAFDFDEFTPGFRVYDSEQLMQAIASNCSYKVQSKDRDRILEAFWGKSSIADLESLCNRIKSL